MIQIDIQNQAALQALTRLQTVFGPGMAPFLQQIGEAMAQRIDNRFATSTDPDGQPWAPNTPVTLQRFMQAKFKKGKDGRSRAYKKDGTMTKAASNAQASKKPLIAEGTLRDQIAAQMISPQEVLISASQKYAAVQQFGAKKGSFSGGRSPWGNIPARRFMPLTADSSPELTASEARLIEAQVQKYLESHLPD